MKRRRWWFIGLVLVSQAQIAFARTTDQGWPGWAPPERITQQDRLGRSGDAILKMGFERWGKVAGSLALPSYKNGAYVVFGKCLAERNDRLLGRHSGKHRQNFHKLRNSIFGFGMACIALEDTLAGGGTYQYHYREIFYPDAETYLYRFLTGRFSSTEPPEIMLEWPPAFPRPKQSPRGGSPYWVERELLGRYRAMRKPPLEMLNEQPANLDRIHKYANLAEWYLGQLEELSGQLGLNATASLEPFLRKWCLGYLSIRGASGAPSSERSFVPGSW
jgi:hypothetical protein